MLLMSMRSCTVHVTIFSAVMVNSDRFQILHALPFLCALDAVINTLESDEQPYNSSVEIDSQLLVTC